MSTRITTEGSTLPASSQTPSVRTFQIDAAGLGGITESVNLYRGDVTVPLTLATVRSRSGLEASATLLATTPDPDEVDTWNLEAPTGLLGLGWKMGFDFIALDNQGTAAANDDAFYLVSEGGSNRLFRTRKTAEFEEFELERFEYWRIRFYPERETWVIVKEEGNQYIFGGETPEDPAGSPVQYGVCWGGSQGNWLGSSVETSGQKRFAMVWNLARIVSPWGDAIEMEYENDLVRVGASSGLGYTRASRLKRVVAPGSRSLTYRYEEKVLSPEVREYQIPREEPGSPDLQAFQNRLDTKFLAALEVRNADDAAAAAGELLMSLRFDYDLVNMSAEHGASPDFFKRYLRSVTLETADGLDLPNYAFEYFTDAESRAGGGEVHRGALKRIVYPQGGTATYGYGLTELEGTALTLDLEVQGTPRVFFGPDYAVLAEIDGQRQGVGVRIFSWNGLWVEAPQRYTLPENVDLETLAVRAEEEFFALSFHSQAPDRRLFFGLFHKQYGRYGQWFMDDRLTDVPIAAGGQGVVVTGRDFAVAVASGGVFRARVWDPRSKTWLDRSSLVNLAPQASYALEASGDYFALASWQESSRRVALEIYSRDRMTLEFERASLQRSTLDSVEWDEETTPSNFWSLGAQYAVTTYMTARTEEEITYKVEIQQWGTTFESRVAVDRTYRVPAETRLPFSQSVAAGGVVGNAEHLYRYTGTRWIEAALPVPGDGEEDVRFVYGDDVAIVSSPAGSALMLYDPFRSQWTLRRQAQSTGAGLAPTAAGDYFSVDQQVLYRTSGGDLEAVMNLPATAVPTSLANRAPEFLAYEDTGNVFVAALSNGGAAAASPLRIANRKIAVSTDLLSQPGTLLVGGAAFFTWTGESFDRPARLTLHHYVHRKVEGRLTARPIHTLEVDDGVPDLYGSENGSRRNATSYYYDTERVTVTPDGKITEFAAATAVYGTLPEPGSGGGPSYPPPEETPFGRSEKRFHNNRSPQESRLVPDDSLLGNAAVYYSFLSGQLFDQTDYDAEGAPVERLLNVYDVVTDFEAPGEAGSPTPMIGGTVQQRRTETSRFESVIELESAAAAEALALADEETGDPRESRATRFSSAALPRELVSALAERDVEAGGGRLVRAMSHRQGPRRFHLFADPSGLTYLPVSVDRGRVQSATAVTRSVEYEYSKATGLLVSDATTSFDSLGRESTWRRQVFYAWQVPGYEELGERHVMSAVALSVRFHQLAGEAAPGRAVDLALTTLRRWREGSDSVTPWAPDRTYFATDESAYDPARAVPARFDAWVEDSAETPGWRCAGKVTERAASGAVLEVIDPAGSPTTSVLDASGTRRLAEFANADLRECGYLGFEAYENDRGGWRLQGGDLASAIVEGDAHTGLRSLRLEPGGPRLERPLSLRAGVRYVLSCWVKTGPGLGDAPARWRVESEGGGLAASGDIAPTGGEWAHRHFVVQLEGEGRLEVTAAVENRAAEGGLLLDDVFISRFEGSAEAKVYHPRFGDTVATLGPNGGTVRAIYDGYRRATGGVDVSGEVDKISSIFLARHQDPSLSPRSLGEVPNAVLEIAASEGGAAADLVQGEDWVREWRCQDLAGWRARNERLVCASGDSAPISFVPSEGWDDYGARVSVHLPTPADGGAPAPGEGPLGLALGEDLAALWSAEDGWTVTLGGEKIAARSRFGEAGSIGTDWLLMAPKDPVAGTTSVFFYVDGELVFSRLGAPAVRGALTLTAPSQAAFSNIATFRRPLITVNNLDGAAKEFQSQAFEGDGVVVTGSVYDPIGRQAVQVKATRVPGAVPGYRPDYVLGFDAESGRLTGLASDANPEDEGYPYARTTFQRTAQSLSDRYGAPGRRLAIRGSDESSHVARMEYRNHVKGQLGGDPFPSNEYFVTQMSDPNGDVSWTLTSKTDQEVAKGRGSAETGTLEMVRYVYDEAGRLSRVIPPKGVAALHAGEADAERFETRFEYSFSGETIREITPDAGTRRIVHDVLGRIRFSQNAREAEAGFVSYFKYDALGRVLEEGVLEHAWNRQELRDKALGDPAWPGASQPHSPLRRHEYDGDGSDPSQWGRLTRATALGLGGAVETQHSFRYDLAGNVLEMAQRNPDFDEAERTMRFGYNATGALTRIGYPEGSEVPEIHRGLDSLGRLARLGVPEDPEAFASFRYSAAGSVSAAQHRLGAAGSVERHSTYVSAGWPESTRFLLPGGREVFGQRFSYTEGGYGDDGYFDGKIASVRVSGDGEEATMRYRYDSLSRLQVAEDSAHPEHSLGVEEPLTYGLNGDLESGTVLGRTRKYHYAEGRGRLERVSEDGETVDSYSYDASGAVTEASRLDLRRLEYEPGTGRTREIEVGEKTPSGLAGAAVSLQYDPRGERSLKTVRGPAGERRERLYVRDGGQSLFEQVRSTAKDGQKESESVQYVYGPEGLTAFIRGGQRYTAIRDNLGSVRRVIDQDGNVVASYSYTATGVTITRENSSKPDILVYRYSGQEHDPETGLYNFRARFYDPEIGRFYEIDPAQKGASPYLYGDNNPVNMVDPDGEEPMSIFLISVLIGAAVGTAASMITYGATLNGSKFKAGKFFLYAVVGAVAGAAGGAAGYYGGLGVALAAGISESTTIAAGVAVGAAGGVADGLVSGTIGHIGVSLIEGQPVKDGLGQSLGMAIGLGVAVGGLMGGARAAWATQKGETLFSRSSSLTDNPADSVTASGNVGSKAEILTEAETVASGSRTSSGTAANASENGSVVSNGGGAAADPPPVAGGTQVTDDLVSTSSRVSQDLQSSTGGGGGGAPGPAPTGGIRAAAASPGSLYCSTSVLPRLRVPLGPAHVSNMFDDAGVPPFLQVSRARRGSIGGDFYGPKLRNGWLDLHGY
ncbi:MAG: RHS repeat-associated core domain-containing protein [Acidobacteriota bacterium]